jgi:hypothetical protein
MTLRDRTGEFFAAADAARRRRVPGKGAAPAGGGSGDSARSGLLANAQPLVVNTYADHSASSGTEEVPRPSHGSLSQFEALDEMRRKRGSKPASDFASETGQIGRDIAAVSTKLERLTKRTLFHVSCSPPSPPFFFGTFV